MINIKCEQIDGIDCLPLPESVGLGYAEQGVTKSGTRNYWVYKAISECENYYQFNDATAFGNPEYNRLEGVVYGMLVGFDLYIDTDTDYIKVYSGSRCIMQIQRPTRPASYFENKKETVELFYQFFG